MSFLVNTGYPSTVSFSRGPALRFGGWFGKGKPSIQESLKGLSDRYLQDVACQDEVVNTVLQKTYFTVGEKAFTGQDVLRLCAAITAENEAAYRLFRKKRFRSGQEADRYRYWVEMMNNKDDANSQKRLSLGWEYLDAKTTVFFHQIALNLPSPYHAKLLESALFDLQRVGLVKLYMTTVTVWSGKPIEFRDEFGKVAHRLADSPKFKQGYTYQTIIRIEVKN